MDNPLPWACLFYNGKTYWKAQMGSQVYSGNNVVPQLGAQPHSEMVGGAQMYPSPTAACHGSKSCQHIDVSRPSNGVYSRYAMYGSRLYYYVRKLVSLFVGIGPGFSAGMCCGMYIVRTVLKQETSTIPPVIAMWREPGKEG